MAKSTQVVAGRVLLVAMLVAATGCAIWSTGPAVAREQAGPEQSLIDASFNTGEWTATNANGSVAIVADGTFWIGKTTKKPEAPFQRQVIRFNANRFSAAGTSKLYSLRFTGKREAGQFVNFDQRPRPLSRPGGVGALEEETNEMGMVMPDEGVVVINGTAPLISVKKATVSSVGTTFAIEANPTDWLLTVIATEGAHKVLVHFPDARTAPKELSAGESIRYRNGDSTPGQGEMENDSPASIALQAYAAWILNQTP